MKTNPAEKMICACATLINDISILQTESKHVKRAESELTN